MLCCLRCGLKDGVALLSLLTWHWHLWEETQAQCSADGMWREGGQQQLNQLLSVLLYKVVTCVLILWRQMVTDFLQKVHYSLLQITQEQLVRHFPDRVNYEHFTHKMWTRFPAEEVLLQFSLLAACSLVSLWRTYRSYRWDWVEPRNKVVVELESQGSCTECGVMHEIHIRTQLIVWS